MVSCRLLPGLTGHRREADDQEAELSFPESRRQPIPAGPETTLDIGWLNPMDHLGRACRCLLQDVIVYALVEEHNLLLHVPITEEG